MKKEKVIKAWLVLCDTEPQYVQMQKSTREEIETAKKFDVKIVPCRIIYTSTPPNKNMKPSEKIIKNKMKYDTAVKLIYEPIQTITSEGAEIAELTALDIRNNLL